MPTPTPPAPRAGERIAKLLARAGIASRREVERMIADGRIAIDGVAVDTPATLLASLAGVTVDGRAVAEPAPARLFAYHKPVGLLVTERDPGGRPTIYDRLPAGLPRVVPVGRLDLATEGLLLLTTDGGLKHQLELPATGVERTYRARAYGSVSQAQLEALIDGIEIDGIRYGSIDANLERRTGANTWIEMTLTEGKNREVRRVLEHLGLQVGRLIRTRYGPFELADMPPGAVGEIRAHDLAAFRASLRQGGKGTGDHRVVAVPFEATADRGAAPGGMAVCERRELSVATTGRTSTDGRKKSVVPDRPRGENPTRPAGRKVGAISPAQVASITRPTASAATGPAPSGTSRVRSGSAKPRSASAEAGRGGDRSDPTARKGINAVRRAPGKNGERSVGRQREASEATRRPRDAQTPDAPPRPPRPARKPGWARAKPRGAPRGKR